MSTGNQVDTSAPGYTQFSTGEVESVVPPPDLLNPAERKTGDDPEVTVTQSTGQKSVVGKSEPAASHTDEVGTTEETIWEGQTSGKSFLVRSIVGEAFTAAWVALAVATWGFGYSNLTVLTYAFGAAILLFWIVTGLKVFRAIHSHHYRLTSRRLFVRTGIMRRRLDQIELLRVKDLFVRQSLLGKWIGVGHVIVVSSEPTLPRATLYGISQPRKVMDLIWLQMRSEVDHKTARVDQV
jgi:hypothetical protein